MRKVELLVIGLGPAGASAARLAARSGLQVLGIDRKARPGLPIQCAEYIPLPLHTHLRMPDAVVQPVRAMLSQLPGGEVHSTPLPGVMINRQRLDSALAEEAAADGAELHYGCRLLEMLPKRQQAVILLNGEEQLVHYDYLLAADGPQSRVARLLGLAPLQTLASYQLRVALPQPMADTEVWLGNDYPGGYAWLFPRGKEANLGLAGYAECAPALRSTLQRLYRSLREQARVGAVLGRSGGPIPVSGLRRPLSFAQQVLFCGDAAGLCHPVSGAGIAPAVLSGEAAVEALLEHYQNAEQACTAYEEEIVQLYGASLGLAVERRAEARRNWTNQGCLTERELRRAWFAFDDYRDSGI